MTASKTPPTLKSCPSTYAADRAALFPIEDKEGIHIDRCPACRAQQEADAILDRRFETEIFANTLDTVTRRVLEEQQTSAVPSAKSVFKRPAVRAGVGLAAAAVLALILVVPSQIPSRAPESYSSVPDPDYIGDKGAVGLEIYCKRGDAVFRVHQGMPLEADDRLRFVPVLPPNTARYLMVVSVDSRGTVSRYFPTDAERAVRVDRSNTPLPDAVILDNTPGAEQVWLLSAETPFDFEPIRDALSREWDKAGSPERIERIPTTIDQTGIVFQKGDR